MRDAPHARVTAALAALAFALRLAWGLAVRAPPAWDGELYERGARAIASGLGYTCYLFGPAADPRVPTAYYPVGYPAYLAAFYALLGAAPWVVALAGSLAGAATVGLAHRVALRASGPWPAAAAALALALMPGQVMVASTPMTETLWGALLLLAVAALARDAAPSRASVLLGAVALAAAAYVRPQALVAAPLLPMVAPGTARARVARTAATLGLVAALLAPWALRNCASLDGCVLVSANGGSNLALGAVPGGDGTYRRLTDADGCRGVVGEAARDRCWRRVAWGHIRRAPWRWASRAWPKLDHTLSYERAPVEYLAAARPQLVTPARRAWGHGVLTWTWRALAAAALVGAAWWPGRRRLAAEARGALAVALAVAATHAVFFGGDRYHLPLAGLLAVVASAATRGALGARGPR